MRRRLLLWEIAVLRGEEEGDGLGEKVPAGGMKAASCPHCLCPGAGSRPRPSPRRGTTRCFATAARAGRVKHLHLNVTPQRGPSPLGQTPLNNGLSKAAQQHTSEYQQCPVSPTVLRHGGCSPQSCCLP